MFALESSADFAALHNIEMRPSLFTTEQRGLSRRAWFDLRNASAIIEGSSDVQGSIFHAHEAAEKFLKIALLHEGYGYAELGKGKLRHNLNNLIEALASKHHKYEFLKKPARDLHSLHKLMSARYTVLNLSLADAVEAFRLARHCVGFVAIQIELEAERGAPDLSFELGHYYHDCSGREYRYCGSDRGAQGELLCLLYLLEASDKEHTIDALIRYKAPCSFHYAEIRDQVTIARLQARYSAIQLKKRLDRGRADQQGVTVERIHESLQAIASIRMPIRREIK
jgi:HEPN domain-containing protein